MRNFFSVLATPLLTAFVVVTIRDNTVEPLKQLKEDIKVSGSSAAIKSGVEA